MAKKNKRKEYLFGFTLCFVLLLINNSIHAQAWSLFGNDGTTDGANFIGTTDLKPFNVRVNNLQAARIDPNLNNTFFGYQSGGANTTGVLNSALGNYSLYSNTTGGYNLANGYASLYSNTAGSYNVANGFGGLYANTSGNGNLANGAYALFGNTIGNYNTANGNSSLYANTTGSYNAATGYSALRFNTTGNYNLASGAYALYSNTTGSYNIGLGYGALYANTTGNYNTALGYVALYANTSGIGNLANGAYALRLNTTGNYNNAIGNYSLYTNTTGNANLASGYYTLYANTSGSNNIANGNYALYYNTTGGNNTANGYQALFSNTSGGNLTAVGYKSLYSNSTGSNNTGIGDSVLYYNTTGSNNTALGYGANVATGSLTNATAIGYAAVVNASNTIQLGNATVTQVLAGTGANAILIAGGLQITGGSLAAGKVLTSDANGVATWQSPGNSSGWSLTGNSGSVDGTNFVGTTDNKPLNFKVNNTASGRIDASLHNSYYGYLSGSNNSSGSYISAFGNGANVSTDGLTNATAIGNGAIVNASNTIQLGNGSVSKVYAGTGSNATLVAGGLQITGGSLGSGKVLTSDGSGVATWQSPAPSGWGLTGNSGTTDGTNFIGTTDNRPFNIRVNNYTSGRIDPTLNNAFFGYQSGYSNPTGNLNTGNGYQALYFNTTGTYNTAIGGSVLAHSVNGDFNTGIGAAALFNNTSGDHNTASGYAALTSNTTGSYNTAIGDYANVNAGGYTNSTAIGSQATITGSNQVVLGNSSVTAVNAYVSGLTNISDGRFKKNIKEDVPGLEFIKLLRPVTFNYDIKGFNNHIKGNTAVPVQLPRTDNSTIGKGLPEMPDLKPSYSDEAAIAQKEKIEYTGLVAQEVEKAANKVGYDFSGLHKPQNDKDTYGLNYTDFVVPLIKSVQELSSSKEDMQSDIDILKSQNNDLQNQLNELKIQMQSLLKGGISSGSTILSSARLEQNIPNPFNQTTLINYYVPESASHAYIKVAGMNGQEIKIVQINGTGRGQIALQTASLASGNYTYSLYVDGNLIDTKVMLLAR